MPKNLYVDVNKEKYMKALFLDIQKTNKMVDLTNASETIYNFVLNNPSSIDHSSSLKVGNDDCIMKDGCIIIEKRKETKKK